MRCADRTTTMSVYPEPMPTPDSYHIDIAPSVTNDRGSKEEDEKKDGGELVSANEGSAAERRNEYVLPPTEIGQSSDSTAIDVFRHKPVKEAPPPPHVHEEAYVPVAYARDKITSMAEDMKAVKLAYQGKLFQLDHFYRQLEKETQEHYVRFIEDLRSKACQRIAHYKHLLQDETKSAFDYKQKSLAEINSLKEGSSLLAEAKARLAEEAEKEARELRLAMEKSELALKAANEHESKAMEDAKQHEHDLLMTDAEKLERTQKQLKSLKEQLQKDVFELQHEYKDQMDELRKHVAAFQKTHQIELAQLHSAKAKEHAAEMADLKATHEAQHAEIAVGMQAARAEELAKAHEAVQIVPPSKSTPPAHDERLNEQMKALEVKIRAALAIKKDKKDAAKQWMDDFEKREGHPPSHEDKSTVAPLFVAARQASSTVKALEAEMEKLKCETVQTSDRSPLPTHLKQANSSTVEELRSEVLRLKEVERALRVEISAREKAAVALSSGDTKVIGDKLQATLAKNARLEETLVSFKEQARHFQLMKQEEISTLQERLKSIEENETGGAGVTMSESSLPTTVPRINSTEIEALRAKLLALAEENEILRASSGDRQNLGGVDMVLKENFRKASGDLENALDEISVLKGELATAKQEAVKAMRVQEQLALEQQLAFAKASAAITPADVVDPKIVKMIHDGVRKGKQMWKASNRKGCFEEYKRVAEKVIKELPADGTIKAVFETDLEKSKLKSAGEGAVLLRNTFKKYTDQKSDEGTATSAPTSSSGQNTAKVKELENKLMEMKEATASVVDDAVPLSTGSNARDKLELKKMETRAKNAEAKIAELEREVIAVNEEMKGITKEKTKVSAVSPLSSSSSKGNSEKYQNKIKELMQKVNTLEKASKDDKVKIRQMENKVQKAEQAAAKAGENSGDGKKEIERALKAAGKKSAKELAELTASTGKTILALEKAKVALTKQVEELTAKFVAVQKERDNLQIKVSSMGAMGKEMETLRAQAAEAADAKKAATTAILRQGELEALYKEESVLRKRYWNMMEDMKGKIRVYCRARPLSKSEKERGNYVCTTWPDEVTIKVANEKKGDKEFVFDQCYGMSSTQEEVFEDVSSLINSAFDGFNVCIFAYGQTGAGKSFTMLGSESDDKLKGITPRAIDRMYNLAKDMGKKNTIKFKAYMCELYNDGLVDLLFTAKHGKKVESPKLDIKKDAKGMVFVKGIEIIEVSSAADMMELFNAGNDARHVGSTKMNAVSSRSHLIFSIIIENLDHTSGKMNVGKLTLVDLAGSERVGKTGATKERLKEAQNINTSLSALGDVISCLSTGAKFIPYRNNKLTMLLADGLGGNAKTLMFVNISPADYNADETQTALVYASRVKMITNVAKKESDSTIVAHLKKIVDEFVTNGVSTTFNKKGLVPHDGNAGDAATGD